MGKITVIRGSVLEYVLRAEEPLTLGKIASALGFSIKSVVRASAYWKNRGCMLLDRFEHDDEKDRRVYTPCYDKVSPVDG